MGSVFNRGTRRDRPNWYVKFKDVDGAWRKVPSGQPTKELAKRFLAKVEADVANGKVGILSDANQPRCGEMLKKWAGALTNRNAKDDQRRIERHVIPKFEKNLLKNVTLAEVMRWIDEQRARGDLSESSIRFNLNLLSRFFSWAIERGHATINPVRQIPQGKRPRCAPRGDVPWLDDDDKVRELFSALPEPINLMFYLCNRSGLRMGEAAGLRMADVEDLSESIRVRFSYEGPLKEDKGGGGKVKFVPAPFDAEAVLGAWLKTRREAEAKGDDLVFPCAWRGGSFFRKEFIEAAWEKVRAARGMTMTWYQATRHSFVSRNLARGASLDEASAALGHSSPVVTRRYYDHFIRRKFSPVLREGLGMDRGASGEVVPLPGAQDSRVANGEGFAEAKSG
ncbi:MAG: tyrosine-type recombinase/integrase [Deltaproteobacteria bacterium]|nr:tyrosine-type recombinase/integrase [Deltaproteobacteria bacterium]